MNKQGGLVAVVLVMVAVTGAAIWLRKKEFNPSNFAFTHTAPVQSKSTETKPGAPQESASAADVIGIPDSPRADQEFKDWIKQEAADLDKSGVDGEAKQRELKKAVAKMTTAQTHQLMLTARNPRAPAGEKILSTYLLVESGSRGRGHLADLIQAPLADKGPHAPHSEEEMKGVRDKSLRIMGIDGLFSQAKRDPAARDALARAIPGIDDPFIRKYAEDKLRQLQ